ncbi:iron ABC transporter permease [Brevibacillus parabrevis]|jgi:ABC-type Fe3+-siderophore transport system, permease component|uniref:Iron ABC transporter permease n=1 Tax=Brevibacillus parabrevis TaxID=54914 RepID=A0A4Y3PKQ2_BREPA|nr:iron ABC transporter permease [Brevibacillus parabrevis]GEB33415.1 iron ABC transporter permease [Brevibacillus parabrevis]
MFNDSQGQPLSKPVQRPIQAIYHGSVKSKLLILTSLFLLLVLLTLYAVSQGAVEVALPELLAILSGRASDEMTAYIVYEIRLPRMVMSIITGVSLACAGAIMQAILRNPLADPFTLGVSSGAAFGAALAIVAGTSVFGINLVSSGQWMIALNAFVFGCLAVGAVYGIAKLKNSSTTVLLLAGVAIGQLFSAGVSGLKFFSNNEALKDLVVWLMGGFWGAKWQVLHILLPLVIISLVLLLKYAWDLNSLCAGEDVARTLGVNVKQVRWVCLLLVTLMASVTIAFTGIIGFIGLVAPHISRIIIGTDYRFLLPCSCLMGALLLLLSDTAARMVLSPIEIPVGIITALFGAPFFVYLLLKKRKDYWA